jgi:hypothetical protein
MIFEPIKALREEIVGLAGVRAAILVTERRAQERLGEAEVEYNMAVKLRGFADAELARKRQVLKDLEEQT